MFEAALPMIASVKAGLVALGLAALGVTILFALGWYLADLAKVAK
jgi:hypothetical protein